MNRNGEEVSGGGGPISDEKKSVHSDDNDDVEDSDSDDELVARLKDIRSLRGASAMSTVAKALATAKDKNDDDDSDDEDEDHIPSVSHRYDEFASFLSRSERAHEKPDVPPSKEELAHRRVTIILDQSSTTNEPSEEDHPVPGIVYYETEPMTSEEMKAYYMQPEDFRRCDADVDITTIRWKKAAKGRGKFDENENTIRGLEEAVEGLSLSPKKKTSKKSGSSSNKQPTRADCRWKHGKNVLNEVVRQKMAGTKKYDAEKIRVISLQISEKDAQRAVELAKQDEDEVARLNPKWKRPIRQAAGNTATSKKEKGKGFFSFLSKKKK